MATENISNMNISHYNWSRWIYNDSRELVKKQPKNRQMRSKQKNSPTPKKFSFKTNFYQKYVRKSKKNPSFEYSTPQKSIKTTNKGWNKEYNVWSMIMQALEQSMLNGQKMNWAGEEFGVRDTTDTIRFVKNREQLNQLLLTSSNGSKTHANDLFNLNDSDENVSLRIKFKLVPVIEGLTVVNGSTETPYTFGTGAKDINNNDNKGEFLEISQTLTFDGPTLDLNVDDSDTTVTNATSSSEYTDFFDDIQTKASSSFISDKENRPIVASANGGASSASRTFFDSPMPNYVRKRRTSNDLQTEQLRLNNLLHFCGNAQYLNELLSHDLSAIENTCIRLLSNRQSDDLIISGINLLSDSDEYF